MIVREIPQSFAFRLYCAKLQDEAERKARVAALKAAQEAIRKETRCYEAS